MAFNLSFCFDSTPPSLPRRGGRPGRGGGGLDAHAARLHHREPAAGQEQQDKQKQGHEFYAHGKFPFHKYRSAADALGARGTGFQWVDQAKGFSLL